MNHENGGRLIYGRWPVILIFLTSHAFAQVHLYHHLPSGNSGSAGTRTMFFTDGSMALYFNGMVIGSVQLAAVKQ